MLQVTHSLDISKIDELLYSVNKSAELLGKAEILKESIESFPSDMSEESLKLIDLSAEALHTSVGLEEASWNIALNASTYTQSIEKRVEALDNFIEKIKVGLGEASKRIAGEYHKVSSYMKEVIEETDKLSSHLRYAISSLDDEALVSLPVVDKYYWECKAGRSDPLQALKEIKASIALISIAHKTHAKEVSADKLSETVQDWNKSMKFNIPGHDLEIIDELRSKLTLREKRVPEVDPVVLSKKELFTLVTHIDDNVKALAPVGMVKDAIASIKGISKGKAANAVNLELLKAGTNNLTFIMIKVPAILMRISNNQLRALKPVVDGAR